MINLRRATTAAAMLALSVNGVMAAPTLVYLGSFTASSGVELYIDSAVGEFSGVALDPYPVEYSGWDYLGVSFPTPIDIKDFDFYVKFNGLDVGGDLRLRFYGEITPNVVGGPDYNILSMPVGDVSYWSTSNDPWVVTWKGLDLSLVEPGWSFVRLRLSIPRPGEYQFCHSWVCDPAVHYDYGKLLLSVRYGINAVPEPSVHTLVIAGCVMMVFLGRKNRGSI